VIVRYVSVTVLVALGPPSAIGSYDCLEWVELDRRRSGGSGRKTERSEERHYVRWVGQSFGERPKDLHFGGTVRQPFFLATLAVRGKVRRVAV
jgi:hypothetical protein